MPSGAEMAFVCVGPARDVVCISYGAQPARSGRGPRPQPASRWLKRAVPQPAQWVRARPKQDSTVSIGYESSVVDSDAELVHGVAETSRESALSTRSIQAQEEAA